MALKLTPKQQKILLLIRDSQLTKGYSPTLQELAEELGVSKVTVFEHVEALVKKGALQRDPNKARSLELAPDAALPDEQRPTRLPLVGAIAAGQPIEAVENREALDLEDLFGSPGGMPTQARTGDTFALRVKGQSMIDEQIQDGDYVICRRAETARNGQTVVALMPDGEATLKKFYREKGRIRLQPANENMDPIYVDDCHIQGIVVGVVRTYQ
jgi:repressor LexA